MKTVFRLLVFCLPLLCAAQKVTLEGTIGNSAIYLTYENYNTSGDKHLGEVRYFYKSRLRDIVLNGTNSGNRFEFVFENGSGDTIREKFSLTENPQGRFAGTWENAKGKKLPVNLKTFDEDAFRKNHPEAKMTELLGENPFDFIRANFTEFQKDSVSVYKGKTLEWFSEKHCKVPFFRLGAGFSETVKSTVNPYLETRHIYEALNQLGCSSRFEYTEENGIDYTIKIGYLDQNLLGFCIASSWFCGGAHPDFGSKGYLVDLHSGEDYEIDDILAFDKSVTTESESNFEMFSEYRQKYFAPKLLEVLNRSQHFAKPAENEDEENCDYTDVEVWDFPSWSFTENGIEFTPYFTRVQRNCEEPFLVPFADLRKYRNPSFPYKF